MEVELQNEYFGAHQHEKMKLRFWWTKIDSGDTRK